MTCQQARESCPRAEDSSRRGSMPEGPGQTGNPESPPGADWVQEVLKTLTRNSLMVYSAFPETLFSLVAT